MSNQNDKKKDFLISLHKALVTDLHEAQRNFISLIVAVIAGMGVFGVGMKAFLDSPSIQNAIYFTVTTAAALLLLLMVVFLANIAGYSYRSYQIILGRIEDKFGVAGEIIPDNWYLCNKDYKDCITWIDPPEIFQFFKRFTYFMMAGIVIAYILTLIERFFYRGNVEMFVLILVVTILYIAVLIYAMLMRFRWSFCKGSYATKLKEICTKINTQEEQQCEHTTR